jgi:hypothetical protein
MSIWYRKRTNINLKNLYPKKLESMKQKQQTNFGKNLKQSATPRFRDTYLASLSANDLNKKLNLIFLLKI